MKDTKGNAPSNYRPRLCVIASTRVREFVLPIVSEFQGVADIEIIEVPFGAAIEVAKARRDSGEVDAFVSAGFAAQMLRSALGVPVGAITVSGFDLMHALLKARQISKRVGVMMFGDTIPRLDSFLELLSMDVTQVSYTTLEEAADVFEPLRRDNYQVIIGSNLAVEMAEKAGLQGMLAYSLASVRDAFAASLEMARIARLEAERYEQLNGVLCNMQEAVLAVNREHRIIAMNPPMAALMGPRDAPIRGKLLDQLAPELSLMDVLEQGAEERGKLQQFAQRDWVINRTAIRDKGHVVGATLTLYDPTRIHEADTRLRTQQRRRQVSTRHTFDSLVGRSPPFLRAIEAARRFARTDLTVLIEGESGVGKELFAQAIHSASTRGNRAFLAVNCAAFAESLLESELFGHEEGAFTGARRGGKPGLFEAAHTGTLFLDEIGDMPLSVQTRLLRVLQERQVTRVGSTTPVSIDVRVIAATHQALDELIVDKRFRQDLYYRLNTLRLSLPALRERPADIELLMQLLFARALDRLQILRNPVTTLLPLKSLLLAHRWPGNVRELENVCERIAVYLLQFGPDDQVDFDGLRYEVPELFEAAALHAQGPGSLREQIIRALEKAKGNRQKAAEMMRVSRSTLWRWCRSLDIEDSPQSEPEQPPDKAPG